MPENNSIKAIRMVRSLFESVHGNLGLLNFNIDKLTPTNGTATEESKKWEIICSFYETLGSSAPTKYKAEVDLSNNTISVEKIEGPQEIKNKIEGVWTQNELKPKDNDS